LHILLLSTFRVYSIKYSLVSSFPIHTRSSVNAEGTASTLPLARVVLRHGKFEHITPALKDLHWLSVQYRVTCKLATLTYSIKRSGQPSYLHELLQDYLPTYSLPCAPHYLFATTRPGSVACRAFNHSAAYVCAVCCCNETGCTLRNYQIRSMFCTVCLMTSR